MNILDNIKKIMNSYLESNSKLFGHIVPKPQDSKSEDSLPAGVFLINKEQKAFKSPERKEKIIDSGTKEQSKGRQF